MSIRSFSCARRIAVLGIFLTVATAFTGTQAQGLLDKIVPMDV
jgi:hypothetical protein